MNGMFPGRSIDWLQSRLRERPYDKQLLRAYLASNPGLVRMALLKSAIGNPNAIVGRGMLDAASQIGEKISPQAVEARQAAERSAATKYHIDESGRAAAVKG